MTQRSIEILIGRLVTDESFRLAFCKDGGTTLAEFIESGSELTALEIAALSTTPARFWKRIARQIDPRLQKASLRGRSEELS